MVIGENSVIRPMLPVPIAGAVAPVAAGIVPSPAVVVDVASTALIYTDGNAIGDTRGHISPLGLGSVDHTLSIRRRGLGGNQIRHALSRIEGEFRVKDPDDIFPYTEAFYLNPSDDIVALHSLSFDGERVLTVGGSGDFPQILSARGACHVDISDVSIPALVYNELKLVAATQLSYEEYQRCFHQWKDAPSPVESGPLIDVALYQHVRSLLSRAARMYWDGVLRINSPHIQPTRNGFARSRSDSRYRKWTYVGDIVSDAIHYRALQQRLRQTQWALQAKEISSPSARARPYDTIYLSNVEQNIYDLKILSTRFVQQGHRRVLFSYPRNMLESWTFRSDLATVSFRTVDGNPDGWWGLCEARLARNWE